MVSLPKVWENFFQKSFPWGGKPFLVTLWWVVLLGGLMIILYQGGGGVHKSLKNFPNLVGIFTWKDLSLKLIVKRV